MENDITIYYSKNYRRWWVVILTLLALIYLYLFFYLKIQILLFFHFLFYFYFILILVSTFKPYLKIKDNTVRSSYNIFKSMKFDEVKEVLFINGDYVFKSNDKKIFIGSEVIEASDKQRLDQFLKDRKLLPEPVQFI